MQITVGRREFVAALGAAVGWPLVLQAQTAPERRPLELIE